MHTPINLNQLATDIKVWGRELGFQQVGIADIDLSQAEVRLKEWLAKGYQGSMEWMAAHGNKRSRPNELLPGTVRVISVRMDYLPGDTNQILTLKDPTKAYVSRYTLGRDYHKLIRKRLSILAKQIDDALPEDYEFKGQNRAFVDSAPVMEVAWAQKAGLGWRGKHTLLLNRQAGSMFFLGEMYVDLPLPVDEETGKPLSKISLTCSKVAGLNNSQEHDSCGFAGTDAQGNFRFPGLTSGRYSVSILTGREEANNHYLKDAHFDLLDDDLSGIEFKATVGEVISGVVVVEGGAKVNLSAVRLIFMIQLKRGAVSFFPSSPMIAPKADGTFRLGGLPPSTVRLQVVDFGRSSIQFLRLERDGSEVTSNLVIGSDEKNTALRLVVGQGKAVIRGQVEFVGEPLPKGWQLVASARHSATQTAIQRGILESVGPREVDVDEKGRFVLEGLLGGEHEVTVVARPPRDIAGKASRPAPATQKVSITSGEEIQITVNFDTALQSKGQKP